MIFNQPFTEDDACRADQVAVTPEMYARATYVGIQALLAFSKEYLNPVLQAGLLGPTDRDKAILFVYWRMFGLLTSVYKLNGPPDFQSIASASRSLLELYLDLNLLIRDASGVSVERFHAFIRVERFRVAEKMVDFFATNPSLPSSDINEQRKLVGNAAERAGVEGLVDRLWGRDKKGNLIWPAHWSQQNARERAKTLGPKFEAMYVRNWYGLSWHIHPGSVGVAGLPKDAFDAFNGLAFHLIIEITADSFSLVANQLRLDAGIPDLRAKLDFLRNVSAFRLTDLRLHELGEPESFTF